MSLARIAFLIDPLGIGLSKSFPGAWSGCKSFSSSQQAESGPAEDTLSAIPFQVSRQTASDAFKEYHRGHLFYSKPSAGLQKIKEAFLPHWITAANANVQLRAAELGFDVWVQRWNPQMRRWQSVLETQWQWVNLERAFWEEKYATNDEGMQTYASYKYPRGEINKLRPGGAVAIARKFQGDMVTSDFDQSTRRVGPFQMKPAAALRFVQQWIREREEDKARQFIKSSFRCDRIGRLEMDIRLAQVRSSPVLVPVFVFRSTHFGSKLRTFVSGISAFKVTGTRALDETRVGLAGGVAGGLFLLASGMYAGMSLWNAWVLGIALPATAAGLVAHYYIHAKNRWDAYWQQTEQARFEAEQIHSSWDPEWVKEYSRLEEEFRRRDEEDNAKLFGSGARGRVGDPRGYYAAMGVQTNASKQELQAAYRGLVMKHHPDRVSGDAEKQAALKKFQAVQEAYSVLRDPAKRKQYDSSF